MADKAPQVQPTISMPSADLITYRFDQTDKKLDELRSQMTNMSNAFATKEELSTVEKRLDNYTWYWRTLVTATLLALASSTVTLVLRK